MKEIHKTRCKQFYAMRILTVTGDGGPQVSIINFNHKYSCSVYSGVYLSFIYPALGGFGEILPEMIFPVQAEGNITIEGTISPIPQRGGYINALLYRKNTWIKKKEKFNLRNKQCKFPRFWRTRAWLPRVVTTNDITPHIPRSKPYTLVIFPAAFIYHAYEEDSALNHMLTWY